MAGDVSFSRPPSTTEAVLGELRRRIAEGELAPGSRLRTDELAQEMGVSRVPVREGFKLLAGEGLVAYEPHGGFFVRELRLSDLREIYRMRELLEAELVRAAVPGLSDVTLGELRAALDEITAADLAGDRVAHGRANRRFHFLIFEAAGLPVTLHHVRLLWDSSDHYRTRYTADPAARAAIASDPEAVMAALSARDAEAAVAALDAHRRRAQEALAAELEG